MVANVGISIFLHSALPHSSPISLRSLLQYFSAKLDSIEITTMHPLASELSESESERQ